eukprot:4366298-Ditylum_brightwellii.AAC.1
MDHDYKNNYFEYPELTQIHGEPTMTSLLTLQNEFQANSQTVNTILGGGAHSHLGLICTAAVYASITGTTPYIYPSSPCPLTLPHPATQHEIATTRDTHQEAHYLFCEVLAVEHTLVQQIVALIEPNFLKAICNSITNKITGTIPQILQYLIDTYGDITPYKLKELRQQ